MRRSKRISKQTRLKYTDILNGINENTKPIPNNLDAHPKSTSNLQPHTVPSIQSKTPACVKESKTPEIQCAGCNKEDPPIPIYPETTFIRCELCLKYWHLECAAIDPESAKKIVFKDIKYPCVICVLNKSPWIKEKIQFAESTAKCIQLDREVQIVAGPKKIDTTIVSTQQKCHTVLATEKGKSVVNNQVSSKAHLSETGNNSLQKVPIKSLNTKTDNLLQEDNILIVDSVDKAENLRSSTNILKRLKEHNIQGVEFAYSLPKGGIVLQFGNKEIKEKTLNTWPTGVFGKTEKLHPPASYKSGSTGFLRNIDPRLSEKAVEEIIAQRGCKVVNVKRCFHRHTGKPMPIVKVIFKSCKDLVDGVELDIGLTYNRKKVYIEKQRVKQVVRCFNCMRYGHISKLCSFEGKCENCGEKKHSAKVCENQPKCANCEDSHRASSTKCKIYQEKVQALKLNILL